MDIKVRQQHYHTLRRNFEAGRIDEALIQYRKALQIDPYYVAATINLGNALLQAGRIEEAVIHYRKALRINPNNISAHVNLASALAQGGQVTNAIPLLEKALELAMAAGDEARAKTIAQILANLNEASRSSPVN